MRLRSAARRCVAVLMLVLCFVPMTARGQNEVTAAANLYLPLVNKVHPPAVRSPWGMNLYLTKRERRGDNLGLLGDLANQAGVRWTREELPWDLIEPKPDQFQTVYDSTIRLTSDKGFGIIGMLLTTPSWARDASCRPTREAYWCPPADVNRYARFAAWMVERYDGDGINDAPGSPRIDAWELWNEPNDVGNWADIGTDSNARKRRYGEMLLATYQAIKAADPTALVILGSVYIFDGGCANDNCDGINFLGAPGGVFQQVPAARQAFDILGTHPFAQPNRPDDPAIPRIVTMEGTSRATRQFLDSPAIGRPDAPFWITEVGWCTAPGACFGTIPVDEEQQANYLIRSMVIAHQSGAEHISWFQLEDAFDDPNRIGGNAAVLRNIVNGAYPIKPAYNAYRTLTTVLGTALRRGTGPVHSYLFDPNQPYINSVGTYDYRYLRGTSTIDVLWRPNDSVAVSFPVTTGATVTLIDRDGGQMALTPVNGAVRLTLSERPQFVVQSGP